MSRKNIGEKTPGTCLAIHSIALYGPLEQANLSLYHLQMRPPLGFHQLGHCQYLLSTLLRGLILLKHVSDSMISNLKMSLVSSTGSPLSWKTTRRLDLLHRATTNGTSMLLRHSSAARKELLRQVEDGQRARYTGRCTDRNNGEIPVFESV